MAAISLTELIAQAKDKMDLHIITLDAEKAFDVVNHPIMLQTLYQKDYVSMESDRRPVRWNERKSDVAGNS